MTPMEIQGLERFVEAQDSGGTYAQALAECVSAVAASRVASAEEIFGAVDAMKLRSSLTLFVRASPEERPFAELLERFYSGVPDEATDQQRSGRSMMTALTPRTSRPRGARRPRKAPP